MSGDRDVERLVEGWLEDRVADPSAEGLREVLSDVPATPQKKARFGGWWTGRSRGARRGADALADPAGANWRMRLMASATGLTAAVAIMVLAMSVSDSGLTQPGPDVANLIVAGDGSGEFSTIAAAVAAAGDGDTVSVKPGTYTEALVIDKDISLRGDGPREEIVITSPGDGPIHRITGGPSEPYAILLIGSNAEVSGLTLTGERSTLLVEGGTPSLRDLHIVGVTEPYGGAGNTDRNALVIAGGSRATLTGSILENGGPLGVYESDPAIVGNTFRGGTHIWGRFGDDAVIQDNHIHGVTTRAIGVLKSGAMLIEGNVITGSDVSGIEVGLKGDSAARIRNNRIVDASTGVSVRDGSEAEVSGNELTNNGIGVRISRSDGQVMGNRIAGGGAGIVVVSGGAPRITDNVIDVTGRGIVAGDQTSPLISGNEVCGGDSSIRIADNATPQVVENRTCEDDVAQ